MRSSAGALILGLLSATITLSAEPAQFAGDWAGTLDAGAKLRLVVHLAHTGGAWTGSMDSIDQGAQGIPFSSVIIDGAKLRFEITSINGVYEGALADDGASIKGTWSQGGMSFPLDLVRGDASSMPGPKRPQEPKPPLPYKAEDVTVPGPGGISLAGTLTTPQGKAPFPVILLISGSGPEDRDETVFGHKPFLVLADYLTRAGIAVLRLDDRGVGKSTGSYATATTADFAQDVLAAVKFLTMQRAPIDATRIGLIGHSEGGIIAPIVAAESKDVAFVVLLAGVGVPADELLTRQASLIMKTNGRSDQMIKDNQDAQRQMFAIVRAEKDPAAAEQKLRAVSDGLLAKIAAADSSMANAAKASLEGSAKMVNTPWFRYWLTLDPAATLRQVKQPVLALNGSLDLQVDAKQNLPVIEKALRDGGNQDVTTEEMPGLNHLFQTAKTGSPMEYATIEETMSPAAMKKISDWILARTSGKKPR